MAHLSAHYHTACHLAAILGHGQVQICAGQGDPDLFSGTKHDHRVLRSIFLDKPRNARREANPSQHVVYYRNAVFLRIYRFSDGIYSLNINLAIARPSV